jgi:methyl-accepting chemotaxis protein
MNSNAREIEALSNSSVRVKEYTHSAVFALNDTTVAVDMLSKDILAHSETTGSIIDRIGEINALSAANARSVEEIAAAAEHLSQVTQQLGEQISVFRT